MDFQLTVPSMACAACAETITKAIQSVDTSAQVIADPQTKKVEVKTIAGESVVRDAIAAVGYPVL